jgi:hypothetical protein
MASQAGGYGDAMSEQAQDPGRKPPLAPDPDSAVQPDTSALAPDVTDIEDIDSGSLAEDMQQESDEKPNAPNRDVDTAAAMPDPDADPWGGSDDAPGRDRA